VELGVLGREFVYDALAAAAAAHALGVPLEDAGPALEGFRPFRMRMEMIEAGPVTVINDAYNANPLSVRAALDTLARLRARGRKVAVLGDMLELGTEARRLHHEVGRHAARSGIDRLLTVGALAAEIRAGALAGGMAHRDARHFDGSGEVREALRRIPIPRSFSIQFTGDYEEQRKANRELLLSIILALLLVYMIMAMLYESVRDPFIVMFSVPLAAIGVILMLFITKTSFNMQSYIGCIMLGGIVVNNAIIIVDYTNLLRRRDKMPIRQAIEEAGRRRLRPILMTAFTAVMATLPLALGLGEGGEAQAPLARTVIGGLTSSTLITLIVVPVVYNIFEDFRRKKEKGVVADGESR
jgi:hypothetical protein